MQNDKFVFVGEILPQHTARLEACLSGELSFQVPPLARRLLLHCRHLPYWQSGLAGLGKQVEQITTVLNRGAAV